jgi:transcription antitermination factor NusG
MSWFVIYTRPQQEKKVAAGLTKIGVEAYCPIVTEVRQWSDRKKKIEVPLIKSYVFVKIIEKERNRVFEVPGVVRYLFWLGKAAEVKDQEIEQLRGYMSGNYQSVKVEQYKVGKIVTIDTGAFKNQSGEVIMVSTKCITVYLEQLGAMVTISL